MMDRRDQGGVERILEISRKNVTGAGEGGVFGSEKPDNAQAKGMRRNVLS